MMGLSTGGEFFFHSQWLSKYNIILILHLIYQFFLFFFSNNKTSCWKHTLVFIAATKTNINEHVYINNKINIDVCIF